MNIQDRILIFHDRKTCWYPPDDIIYFLADGSYSLVATARGEQIIVSKNLKHISETLPSAYTQFIRVHKSWVININHINIMYSDSPGKYLLQMSNGVVVPLGGSAYRNKLLSLYESAISIAQMSAKVSAKSLVAGFTGMERL